MFNRKCTDIRPNHFKSALLESALLENYLWTQPGALLAPKQIISQIVAWISLTYRVVIEYLSRAWQYSRPAAIIYSWSQKDALSKLVWFDTEYCSTLPNNDNINA